MTDVVNRGREPGRPMTNIECAVLLLAALCVVGIYAAVIMETILSILAGF